MLLHSAKPELVLSFSGVLACTYVFTSDKCKATWQMHFITKISSVGSFFFQYIHQTFIEMYLKYRWVSRSRCIEKEF